MKYVRQISNSMDPPSSDVTRTSVDESPNLPSFAKLLLVTSKLPEPSKFKSEPLKPSKLPDSSKLPEPSKFKSSVTIFPSTVVDTATYSDLSGSDISTSDKSKYLDSEMNLFGTESPRKRRVDKRRRAHVEIEIRQRGGTLQRNPRGHYKGGRNECDKELFYDPDLDSVQESRDQSIKEPKYKRCKRESFFKSTGEYLYVEIASLRYFDVTSM